MATPTVSQETIDEAVRLYGKLGSSNAVAKKMGCSSTSVQRYLARAGIELKGNLARGFREPTEAKSPEPSPDGVVFPDFPSDDIPVESIIELQCKRFETRQASYDAHTWFPIKLKSNAPMGILWFGDPHVDDNGCNWPVLKRHADLCRETDGLYGVNIGDTTNCWGGRLIRKYADQDTSAKTARRLAEWFLIGSGVKWLVWLYGNHEHMGDGMHVLAEMAKRYGTKKIVMHDWEARFCLQFPNQESFRIYAAHDFAGNSMWNPLHGPVKAAKFGDRIDLLVCGHKHNWAISQWEMPEQGMTPLMIRTRGYKHFDDFARKLGFQDQDDGQAVLTVFDPNAKCQSGRVTAFVDVERGVEYLKWLRSKA